MVNFKLIAEALIGLSCKEVKGLAEVLRDEYGIVAAEVQEANRDLFTLRQAEDRQEQKRVLTELCDVRKKQKMLVPRKIGKPCKPYIARRK